MRWRWLLLLAGLLVACQPELPLSGRYEGNLTHDKDQLEFRLKEEEGQIRGRYRLRYYSRSEDDLEGKITGHREHNQLFLEFKRAGKPAWKAEGSIRRRPFADNDRFEVDRLIGPRKEKEIGTIPDDFFDGIETIREIELTVVGAENHKFQSSSNTLIPELRKRLQKRFP